MNARLLILCFVSIALNRSFADIPASKKPITEKEARAFCEEFAKKYLEGDGVWLSNHIDIDSMVWRATDGKNDIGSQSIRGLAKQKLNGVSGPIRGLIGDKNDIDSYKFRSLKNDNGSWKALFRLVTTENFVNFHEAELSRIPGGAITVSELFIFATGETITETYRSLFQESAPLVTRPPQNADEQLKFDRLDAMTRALKKGEYEAVLELFEKLPEEVKKYRIALLLRLKAAIQLDSTALLSALVDFSEQFPGDTAKDTVALPILIDEEAYEEAIAAIDRLTARVGDDAQLTSMKAGILLKANKPYISLKLARHGMKLESDLIANYFVALDCSLVAEDYELTKQMIETIESRFGETFGDLSMDERFSGFVQSREYEMLMQSKNRNSK